tara:strand:- start:569 stop:790 length:222 start_codon:yes stop_codon:yes gene_type:complete
MGIMIMSIAQDQIDALKEANKMLRKVKAWKNGKRTMVGFESINSKNFRNIRVEARNVWGSPDAVVRDRAVKSA